ncbi:hypothetical protein FRB99_004098 [Tulasnella sp. 403]|nr:hypothetical protein FRB99_004098 [Tulasnella sp. 403]
MEPSVLQHLHSVTLRTLHAHSFNRASSVAAHVLTDILSRYLSLLAATSKAYAEHSGRDGGGVNVWDVLGALDELGVSLEELEEFSRSEGREMSGYGLTKGITSDLEKVEGEALAESSAAARRLDSLADIKSAISEGLETDFSDTFMLDYRPLRSPILESRSSPGSSPPHSPRINGIYSHLVNGVGGPDKGKGREIVTDNTMTIHEEPITMLSPRPVPPLLVLPLSPVSNPSYSPPPSRSPDGRANKRPRHASWNPPEHIPDFLPPFPGSARQNDQPMEENTGDEDTKPAMPPPPPRRIPLPLRPSTTSKSSYTKSIAYSQSSAVPRFGDLPDEVPLHIPLPSTPNGTGKPSKATSSLQPLIAAYHVLQTDTQPATNPSRLRVAHLLAASAPIRYSTLDSLFSSSTPSPPRCPAPLPTFPVPISSTDPNAPPPSGPPLPKVGNKVVSDDLKAADQMSTTWMQSNLLRVARGVLPPHLYAKVTQQVPPPPLRPPSAAPNTNTKDANAEQSEPLLYHKPISAPWNSSADANEYKKKDAKKNMFRDMGNAGKKLPEASLFATWDWTTKEPEEPLAVRRGRLSSYPTASFVGGVVAGGVGPAGLSSPSPSLNGLRSPAPTAKGFAVPGLPASAMKSKSTTGTDGTTINISTWANGTAGHPSPAVVLKSTGRKLSSASINGVDATHHSSPVDLTHRE